MSEKIFLLMVPHMAAPKPNDKNTAKYVQTSPASAPDSIGFGRMKNKSTRNGTPTAMEKFAMVGGPWSGKRRETKFNSNPLAKFENALPQPNAEKTRPACPWLKHDNSSHCVKKGNTVHGAVPGAPWHKMSTKVGYLKSCNTLGMFSENTVKKLPVRRFSAKRAAFGSDTQNAMATPTTALKAATTAMLMRHPGTPITLAAAYRVATKPKTVLQTPAAKKMEPKAEPRFDGGVLSATMLSRRGWTMPNPTPLRSRPANNTWNDGATAHIVKPMDQKTMPAPTSCGLGNMSPRKPHGNANKAATQPFAVESKLSEVCETRNSTWNSWKNIGKTAASMAHATLHKHNSTYSNHCRPHVRESS
mmetsp:Transcript_12632/g.36335  ORF Transcript_12632/g.36335 Transcript_12632/m.36335 type:complete len:360 (-) Transcript_12632:150-1229(-)